MQTILDLNMFFVSVKYFFFLQLLKLLQSDVDTSH